MREVVSKEVMKLIDVRIVFPIIDSKCISLIQCVPKKGGVAVVRNEKNELILTRRVSGWRICMDYCKLNDAIQKDHYHITFIDHILDGLQGQ